MAKMRIDKRPQRQQQRIEPGVASGELNKRKTARLQRQQDAVQTADSNKPCERPQAGRSRLRLAAGQCS